jgi:hypothetical protein
MASSLDAVLRTTRESPALATTMRSPVWRRTARYNHSGPRPSGGCAGAYRTHRRMRPRRTASRGRTNSRQAFSRRRWATPTRAPPFSGFCSGFLSKKHVFIFGVGLWKWLTSEIHGKNITENKCHTCKKRILSWKHYSNKINYMQGSSLNILPPSKNKNSRISVIFIYYYTLCKGSR